MGPDALKGSQITCPVAWWQTSDNSILILLELLCSF